MGHASYRLSHKVSGWKRHECRSCGCEFRYRFARQVAVRGASEGGAEAKADSAAEDARGRQVDVCPCPDCGYCQPDMVARWRRPIHLVATLAAGGLLLLLALAGAWGVWSAAVVAVCGAAHAVAVLFGPNRDLRANRAAADRLVDRDKLDVLTRGDRRGRDWQPAPSFAAADLRLLALHLVPLLLFAGVAFVPRESGGGDKFPAVIERSGGVGRTIRVPVGAVSCYDEHWRATAEAVTANADDFPAGGPAVTAASRQDQWNRGYTAGRTAKAANQTVWVDLHLPDDPALAGRTLDLDVTATVTYTAYDQPLGPVVGGGGGHVQFVEVQGIQIKDATTRFQKRVKVHLTAGWAPSLSSLGVVGQFVGLLATVGLGLGLVHRSRKLAEQAVPPVFETNAERKDDLKKRGTAEPRDDEEDEGDPPRRSRRRRD